MPINPAEPTLSEENREIVRAVDTDALIVANAGAGKTTLLVEHYFELLSRDLDPMGLIAFTFTEKAAGEMKQRILERFSTHPHFANFPDDIIQDFKVRTWNSPIGTIHQFCLQLILESQDSDRGRLKIIEEASELQLQEQISRRHVRKRLQEEDPDALLLLQTFGIQNLKRLMRDFLEAGKNSYGEQIPLPSCLPLETRLLSALASLGTPIREELEVEKRRLGWIHFDDMERRCLALLKDPPPNLTRKLKFYTHALIDEFQDTSPIQIEIVETLRETLTTMGRPLRLFCVGDPKQSIYRFRKVDRNLIAKSERDLLARGGKRFESVQSFRSAPAILRFVNAFAERAFPEAAGSRAALPEKPDARVRLIQLHLEKEANSAEDYRKREAAWVAKEIERQSRAGIGLDSFAVLARSSASFLPLIRELKARDIAFAIRGGQELLDRQEILDLIRLLRFLNNPTDDLSLVGVLRSPLFLISDLTLLFLRDLAPKGPLWEYLKGSAYAPELRHLKAPDVDKLSWTVGVLARLAETAALRSPSGLLSDFLNYYEISTLVSLANQDPDAALALEQFLAWLAQMEDENQVSSLGKVLDIVENLRKISVHKTPLGNLIDLKNCVHLLTVHAAKGLEFDTVFAIDLERPAPVERSRLQHLGRQYALKLPPEEGAEEMKTPRFQAIAAYHEEEENEENKRLLYVAITRPKQNLIVTLHPKPRKKNNLQTLLLECLGERAKEWMEDEKISFSELLTLENTAPIQELSLPHEVPPPPFPSVPGGINATVSDLETFEVCPLKHHYLKSCGIPDSSWEDPWSLSPTEMGTLLHTALRWLAFRPRCSPREALEAVYRDRPNWPNEAVAEDLAETLRLYLASPGWESIVAAKEDFSELPFVLQLHSGKVRGQIDRLIRTEDGTWRLIDFKYVTRRSSETEIRRAYAFQLKTYALAAKKFLKIPPERVQIHLLGALKVLDFSYSAVELDDHQKFLEATLARMRAPHLQEVESNPGCFSCRFNEKIPLCGVPHGRPWTPEKGMFL